MRAYIDWKMVLLLCLLSGIIGWFTNDYFDRQNAHTIVSDSVHKMKQERIDYVLDKIQKLDLEKADRNRKLSIIDSLILLSGIDTSATAR